MKSVKHSAKKAIAKKLVKAHKKMGASPIKMDNGLGATPLDTSTIGSGGGSNLGTNGVF